MTDDIQFSHFAVFVAARQAHSSHLSDLAFLKTGQLLREHVRQKRGWYRMREEDHPQRTPLAVSQMLWRAGRAGAHVGTLCNLIYSQQGEVGVRRILGVLSLTKKHGPAAVDEACAAALEMGESMNIASYVVIWSVARKRL